MSGASEAEKRALRRRCDRWLSGDRPKSAAAWAQGLLASPHIGLDLDSYSDGPAIALLEQRVAQLLGKPAALWFPKGIMAQQAALLAHAARGPGKVVALHPRSHLALDEADALCRLAGLTMARIGRDQAHFEAADLERLAEPLAAVTVETPLRRAGFLAMDWEALEAVSAWARARGVPVHLDGARLWEAQPGYGRPLDQIAALADSVYVSLYKGLGGMAGCVLAGSEALIAAVRPWRLRYGGDLPLAFPLIVSALDGLDRTLPRMGAFHAHALALAEAIGAVEGIAVFPDPPHSNAFQVRFAAAAPALEAAALDLAREREVWLAGRFEPGGFAGTAMAELVVGPASLDWTPADAAAALAELLARARG